MGNQVLSLDTNGQESRRRRSIRHAWEDFSSTPTALVGTSIVAVFLILSLVGPLLAPYSAFEFSPSEKFAPPSVIHWFGTDSYGRDVFSRVMVGARLTFLLAASATIFSLLLGTPIGLVSGYLGGWVDEVIMRLTDALLALPSLVLALLIVSTLGGGMQNVVLAVGITYAPRIARVVRSRVLQLRESEFIQAAIVRGESTNYILFSELLPNTWAPIIVEGSIRMGFAILAATSLSYLGIGVSPPNPDWGLMISEARFHMYRAPWLVVFPSLAIALTIVGFNLMGDGLRNILDPRRTWQDVDSKDAR